MRAVARREGGSTDTTRDHEYTDWDAVNRFADQIVDAVRPAGARLDVVA
jgi:menaquinone-dependent protoporphyrinogen oxidase